MSTQKSPFSLFGNPTFLALALMRFAVGMTFATIIIALALYADLFEASGIVAGLFGASYAAMRLVLVLPVGRITDVYNTKRILLFGLALHILVLVGFIIVQAVEHVIVLRALQGIGSILLYISGMAIIGSYGPDSDRGRWIGTYQQVSSFSSLSGDLVGGALLFAFGFEITYLALIGISILATAAVIFLLDDRPVGTAAQDSGGVETLGLLVRRRPILALITFRFSFSFGKMAVILFLPIYARTEFGMSALLIGGILAGGKLTKSVLQGYVGIYADRFGHMEWFIVAGIICYAIGTAFIPFAAYASSILDPMTLSSQGRDVTLHPAFFSLFLAYVILGIGDSLRIPTSLALFVREGEHYDAVGGSLSLRSVSWQIGAVVGPLAVGGMLDVMTYFEAFWLAAAFMIAAGIMFIGLYQEEPAPRHVVGADD